MELKTRVRSRLMRVLASEGFQRYNQRRARLGRRLRGQPPVVHYFHQVDDPYSHLAVQRLAELNAAYDLDFEIHLTSAPDAPYLGSAEHFDYWALRDAASVAPNFGVTFPANPVQPTGDQVRKANDQLALQISTDVFPEAAIAVGASLLAGEPLADTEASGEGAAAVRAGNALQTRLGHYQGAMFYFDGEWYWGLDRLRVLEARLIAEGFGAGPVRVPEPKPLATTSAGQVTLEYFPSLRSPYTAIGHRRVLAMIARTGVTVHLRPVMPMMMRGIPAPTAKQRSIITDSAREGRYFESPMDRTGMVDPFGEPVRRAFALFPAACKLGHDMDFVSAYLRAAFEDGVDICEEAGLRQVVATAGMDWNALQSAREGTDWEAVLEENLQEMIGASLWGVPSFRVSGGNAADSFACWGQDRIWRVEDEIARRCE